MRRDYKPKRFKKHKIRDYRRKAGKYKNPLFAKRTEKIQLIKIWRKRALVGAGVVLGIGLIYIFLIGPYFYINKVNVEGLETIKGNDFQELVDKFLASRRLLIFPNSNAVAMNKGKLARMIGEEYVLDELKIDRDFPKTLNICVKERLSNAILVMDDNYFYLDSRGVILRRLTESEIYPGLSTGPYSGEVPEFQNTIAELNLPMIYVQSFSQVEIGSQFLDQEKYEKILSTEELLTLYTPYELDHYKINDLDVNWFKLVTTGGWEIHIDLDKNIQTQIVKVHTFITEQGLNPSDYQYFNVRYEDRIYYK